LRWPRRRRLRWLWRQHGATHSTHSIDQGAHRPFAERALRNIGPQSAVRLAARITLPHFSVSSATNFPNAADVIDIGLTPKLASRAFIRGSAATALISLLSFSITSAGVSFGAPTPNHWLISYPGTNSARVGISGSTSECVAVVTASARSMPPLMYWM